MFALAALLALLAGLFAHDADRGISIGLERQAARPADLPAILGSTDISRPLIVIDPGHGGSDPGATAHEGTREKDVTLAIARAVRDALVQKGRVRVALTRDGDIRLGLRQRYEIARQLGAKLFISIHTDAAPNIEARGATVYSLSEVASDGEAALLARRENAAELVGAEKAASDAGAVNRILIDLAQRESMAASSDFADLLVREAAGSVPLRPEPRHFASLLVLKAPDTPSVLFEAGYLTNKDDAAFLLSPEGRARIAGAVARAVEIHAARITVKTR